MKLPKYFICPATKNVTDSVLELKSSKFGLIPTRRQIDYNGGYVNNWNTKSFYEYVRNSSNIILERDHGGPLQGTEMDDGYRSYEYDVNYFDIIHIDPWKSKNNELEQTVQTIKHLFKLNPNLKFEIGTEETIRKFEPLELENMLRCMKDNLTHDEFNSIEYVVIQSGVGLDLVHRKNTGIYDETRLNSMIHIIKSFNKKSKEHNGDYLSNSEFKLRFDLGVDGINIGPELAQIETLLYLKYMTSNEIDEYYKICLESNKWKRWISSDFDINDKEKLIQICGHYCFHLYELPNIDGLVKQEIKNKLNTLP